MKGAKVFLQKIFTAYRIATFTWKTADRPEIVGIDLNPVIAFADRVFCS
ncbi:hypothetical protein [Desulfobacterium sp. N47]|uniref:Uncharacterized protein n=1 Tax=uncultured Desulfobacterium sp. TaxID=201089 RepID=E1YKL9_9BACT|nr:unknown protein [uncultured Desulfobacterium sp.]